MKNILKRRGKMSDKYTLAVIVTIAFLVVINVVCNWDYFYILLTFIGIVAGTELLHGLVCDLVEIFEEDKKI